MNTEFDFTNLNCICVTGKMASGKNFFCKLLEQKGFKSIDADLLVHNALEDSQIKAQILKNFLGLAQKQGLVIQKNDGQIDRRQLGKLLFKNPKLLQIQEKIVYPYVTKNVESFILQNKKSIINATLLFKTPELLQKCDAVFYVKSSFFKQIIRAKKRDGLETNQIISRLKNQRSLLKKYKQNMNKMQKLFLVKN